jgi:hypothetical protein
MCVLSFYAYIKDILRVWGESGDAGMMSQDCLFACLTPHERKFNTREYVFVLSFYAYIKDSLRVWGESDHRKGRFHG